MGQTDTGPLAEPAGQNTRNTAPADLSGPAVYVSDRFVNSHREASSPRPATYETHTVASQKQLEGTRITGKGDPNSQVPAPPFTMVARKRQCSNRPTITPNETCSANLYRRIKRRVGRSLKRAYCKRNLVPSRKQAAYQLSRTKGSLLSFKRVPRPLHRQDSSCSNRQQHSGIVYKQGRLLEPQQSRSRVSLRQWQQELRLLKGDPPDQSMRQNWPFLQSDASLIRWTSGHPCKVSC